VIFLQTYLQTGYKMANVSQLPARWSAVFKCGRSSVVERHLAKVEVEGSNPFARSSFSGASFLEHKRMSMPRILLSILFLTLSVSAFAQNITPPVITQTQPSVANQDAIKAEQLSQQIRAEERKLDLENTGLKYIPWTEAGKSVQDFVASREPFAESLIGNGRHLDIAVYDMDQNGQPDIVLYFWDHCGNQGCLFKIYYDTVKKKSEDYFGWEFIPYKKGVMLDHAYFSL